MKYCLYCIECGRCAPHRRHCGHLRCSAVRRRVFGFTCDRCTYQFLHISLSSISSMMMQMVALLCVKWGKFELILTGPTNLLVGLASCQPGLPH